MKIYCNTCQKSFNQSSFKHINCKQGCPKCGDTLHLTFEEFVDRATKIHSNKYDYSNVIYKTNKIKIKILCKKCNEIFTQRPNNHLCGDGCPKCKESLGEKNISNILKKYDIQFKKQKTFKDCKHKCKLRFDFYLPDINTCIEYDGKQHFEAIEYFGGEKQLKEQQIKDSIKNEYCKNNNITLLRISYKEDLIEKLNEFLNKCI